MVHKSSETSIKTKVRNILSRSYISTFYINPVLFTKTIQYVNFHPRNNANKTLKKQTSYLMIIYDFIFYYGRHYQRYLTFMEPHKNISAHPDCSGNSLLDFGEFRLEQAKKEFDCNYFNEDVKKDIVKHEPEISEGEEGETNFKDPKHYLSSFQKEIEEKFAIKLNTDSDKLSTNTTVCITEQIKIEDNFDIIHENIKTEISEKEISDSKISAICELCHNCFANETDFIKHKSEEDSKCISQESNGSSLNNIQDSGLQLHLGIKKETAFKEEITNETASSAVPQKDGFFCKICLKSFKHKSVLKVHERVHTGEKPFQCEICPKSFTRSYHLKTHNKIHTGENPFQCKVCSKSFNRKDSLEAHERGHTGEKPFNCEFCLKSFNQKYRLNDHEKIHTGEKPFQCEICLKSFNRRNHLRVHERIHTGERPYQCEICSKSFNQRINLKAHEKTHAKERLFHCEICSKSFNHGSTFRIHERIHTGEKPFRCKACSKSFSRRNHLIDHEWIHTGKKPFRCEICSKNFSRRHNLRNHERSHTDGQPFDCNLGLKSFSQRSTLKLYEETHAGETPLATSDLKQENPL